MNPFAKKSPPPPKPGIVIHPLRPAAIEALTPAEPQHRHSSPQPSAARLARDPRAYPAAPPRAPGAVQRTYTFAPDDV